MEKTTSQKEAINYKAILEECLTEATRKTLLLIDKRIKSLKELDVFKCRAYTSNEKKNWRFDSALKDIVRPIDRSGMFVTYLRSEFNRCGMCDNDTDPVWKEFFANLTVSNLWSDVGTLSTGSWWHDPLRQFNSPRNPSINITRQELEKMVERASQRGHFMAGCEKDVANDVDSLVTLDIINKEMESLVANMSEINEESEKIIEGLAKIKEDFEAPINSIGE